MSRTEFLIIRVTKEEKLSILQKAGLNVSKWIRKKLGLK